jgi:regulator of nucleoside diphosphate kinase
METLLLEQSVLIRDLDHLRLREWLEHLPWRLRSQVPGALRRKLCEAEVVPREKVPRNVVTMNSLVGLRDVERDERFSCMLVYPDQADLAQRKVSVAVPLGSEMLGRRVGAVLACPLASGVRRMRIERVYYQPEAAGDFRL